MRSKWLYFIISGSIFHWYAETTGTTLDVPFNLSNIWTCWWEWKFIAFFSYKKATYRVPRKSLYQSLVYAPYFVPFLDMLSRIYILRHLHIYCHSGWGGLPATDDALPSNVLIWLSDLLVSERIPSTTIFICYFSVRLLIYFCTLWQWYDLISWVFLVPSPHFGFHSSHPPVFVISPPIIGTDIWIQSRYTYFPFPPFLSPPLPFGLFWCLSLCVTTIFLFWIYVFRLSLCIIGGLKNVALTPLHVRNTLECHIFLLPRWFLSALEPYSGCFKPVFLDLLGPNSDLIWDSCTS